MRVTVLLLALCTIAFHATAAEDARPQEASKTITLVSSLPLTGSSKGQTEAMVNGIRMAIDEVNGTVIGHTIKYLPLDDATAQRGSWDSAKEQANAASAIQDPDVMAYIGTYNSGAAKIVMADLNRAGLAMISPANTAIGLTKPGAEPDEPAKYRPTGQVTYFRVVPADDIQGAQGARWAKDLGAKKVYILHDRELYGEGLAKVFRSTAQSIGLEVVGYDGINARDPNYRSLVVKIKAANADLVYFGGTTQTNAGQIAKDLVMGGSTAKMMFPDGCYETAFIEAGGAETLNGRAFITFGGLPPKQLTGKGAEFVAAYEAKYGLPPEAYAIYAYEAAKVTIDAIRRAGVKDRAKIVEALRQTKDFTGALGTWSFDANGDTTLTLLSGNTVTDGAFTFVKLLGSEKTAATAEVGTPSDAVTPGTDVGNPVVPETTPVLEVEPKSPVHAEKPAPIGLLVVAGVVALLVVILLLRKPKA